MIALHRYWGFMYPRPISSVTFDKKIDALVIAVGALAIAMAIVLLFVNF
jgi:hypothetical protein